MHADRVRVSERLPVTGSTTVRSKTPFSRPTFRYSVLASPSCPVISSTHSDSALAGSAYSKRKKERKKKKRRKKRGRKLRKARQMGGGLCAQTCMLSGCRQSAGSRETTRTVPSAQPIARNRDRCASSGT